MKYLFILLAGCLLMGCSTLMPQEKFFCTISTKDIPDVPENTISYKTDYLDYHVVEAGTISSPLFDYDIKYDTLSHYRVSVMGYVVFGRDANNTNQHERIDSVGITHLVIDKIGAPRELFGKKGDERWNKRNWEECYLPNKILKKIRKDFFIRMKYQRYVFNYNITEPIKAITAGYGYRSY
ncbi:MAG: hypothetical protein K5899_07915 [Bacteroidaceae bacterium]|nr:hypothetical protein [Bacteroidaceae bacterium]